MNKALTIALFLPLLSCRSETDEQHTQMKDVPIGHPEFLLENSVADSATFDRYCNARFEYCISYPKEILHPKEESQNGDGREFTSGDGVRMLVFGRRAMTAEGESISMQQSFDTALEDCKHRRGIAVTYQKLGSTFFVISGLKDGKVLYLKTIVKGEAFAILILEYPETKRSTFDALTSKISASFK